jgi:phospholipase C
MSRKTLLLGGLVVVATAVMAGTQLASARIAKPGPPKPTTTCNLGTDGKIKHVVYIQFDNVHFNRDNPDVPSDLEQMPNLLHFIQDNGTLDTNDHTVLISHTGGGILTSLTGLYPDRQGQAVSNAYGYFRPDGSVGFSSSFKYWTDNTDGGNPANNPPTASADPNYNMVNNDPPSLGGTGASRNTPAPWVPYAKAGCDVGGIGLANIELENNTAIITRSPGTTLAAASAVGATNIKVTSVTGLSAGQTLVLENATANSELATIVNVGTAGSGGTGVDLTAPLTKAHASGAAMTVATADPTGDMTKVFGSGSPEWNEGRASQIAPSGTAARALAQTDFVGIAVHCGVGGGICNASNSARADVLPDEMGGYTGFKGLFGSKIVNPVINHGSASVNDLNSNKPIVDPFGQPGFPGFDGMLATNSLGITAQMQEAGIPVTFTYISDAHDNHGNSGNIHAAYGPGEAGYVQQLKDYDTAFGKFFTRLQNDGIDRKNTLFVITVEEGDHFAGTNPDGPCDGVTTPCTYANGHVTEVNGDLKRMVATYNATHGTSATTDFSVHSDLAPNVYVTGNPARDSATARNLEKVMSDLYVTNPLHGNTEDVFTAMADPVGEKVLHMVTADAARTPTFTPFAQGDYFLSASSTTPCTNNDLNQCLTIAITNPQQTFAWNHGGIQPEIASTWLGMVGPGVQKNADLGDGFFSDHADVRPTMLELLGLKDSYVSDGRVLTELLKNDALPDSLKGGKVEQLGQAWKQINAAFGQLSADVLTASTGALASNSSGDSVYADAENEIQSLGDDRDALAGQIRLALWNAEFNGKQLDDNQMNNWLDQADELLSRADDLANTFSAEPASKKLDKIDHIVVIYEENHSFDNLYGGWEGVNGLQNADPAHTLQKNQAGNIYACLKQNDVNLASPTPLATTCNDATVGTPGGAFVSHFTNQPFLIDQFIAATDTTCPPNPLQAFSSSNGFLKGTGSAGGCTRDIVHRFYQEQYQLDGGKQDHYTTGSDAMGLTQGYYDTTALPIYQYLHSKKHPDYAIEDNFFQAAFGGSFLNHQWLIAAASPVDPTGAPGGANETRHPVLDSNGMPANEPLYTYTGTQPPPPDRELTATCANVATLPPPLNGLACGNYGVNTMQPVFYPSGTFGALLPAQTGTTIGDELTAAGVDWAWYSGGWSNADGDVGAPGWTNGSAPSATPTGCSDPYVDPNSRNGVPAAHWPRCPDNLFQYHHQPFNYFAAFSTETAAGQANRAAHLKDEQEFIQLANSSGNGAGCNLKPVSFVKPFGTENEHPGYASEPNGSDHLVSLIQSIESSKACAKNTLVIVAYDEFGGQWDHVPPPGQGNNNGPFDIWGPGTRIAALVVAPKLKHNFVVDSMEHDTTSILATIEHRFGLSPLGTRDAAVNDLSTVFKAEKPSKDS